jgi:type II secretion system protein N
MSPKSKKILTWVGYPIIYIFLLVLFIRITLPFERARTLIQSRINSAVADSGMYVEIGELGGYWFTGLELRDVTITETVDPAEEGAEPKKYVSTIEELQASVSPFSLLGGDISLSFSGDAFGGTLDGDLEDDSGNRSLSLNLEDIDISALPMLDSATGMPRQGRLTGTIDFTMPEGKLSESVGEFDVTITGFKLADGETKIQGMLALPTIDAGTLQLKASVINGNVEIKELEVKGADVEASASGKVKLKDPFDRSLAELQLKFGFQDGYKDRTDITKAMLGDSGGKVPGLMDMDPKVKRAKQADGTYAWRVSGPIKKLRFSPGSKSSRRKSPRRATKRGARGASPAGE